MNIEKLGLINLVSENKKISIKEIQNNLYEVKKYEVTYQGTEIYEKTEIRKMSYFEYCQLIILAKAMHFRIIEVN